MNESFLSHLEIVATMLVPLGIAWYTTRKDNARMHQENQNRLIAIETRLEPLWRWYNNYKG